VVGGEPCQLDPRVDVELRKHVSEMAADGVRGDEKLLGHFSIGQSLSHQPRDGKFGVGHGRPGRICRLGQLERAPKSSVDILHPALGEIEDERGARITAATERSLSRD